eukprot:5018535-Pleurochrysis_carterae.AAC.3
MHERRPGVEQKRPRSVDCNRQEDECKLHVECTSKRRKDTRKGVERSTCGPAKGNARSHLVGRAAHIHIGKAQHAQIQSARAFVIHERIRGSHLELDAPNLAEFDAGPDGPSKLDESSHELDAAAIVNLVPPEPNLGKADDGLVIERSRERGEAGGGDVVQIEHECAQLRQRVSAHGVGEESAAVVRDRVVLQNLRRTTSR